MKLAKDPALPGMLGALITIVLSIGVFVLVTARNGTPIGIYDNGIGDHWQVQDRNLTVVDRTGDPAWHQAIVAAVATWAPGGSAMRLVVTTATGRCAQQRDRIEYCQATTPQIASNGEAGDQGLFQPKVGRSHDYRSAIVLVCSDCAIDRYRMTVIATHELGHALGLAHNPDLDSVMYYEGGSIKPDAHDYQELRKLEGVAPMGE